MFSNIKKVEIKIGALGAEAAKKSATYRFNIYSSLTNEPLTINMKPFSQRNLAILADAIATKVASIEMDERVQELKDDNFKPNVSEGIRQAWQIALIVFAVFLALALAHALRR